MNYPFIDNAARPSLCPVCGERITIVDTCKLGRCVGSCGDAFWASQWGDVGDVVECRE